MSLITTTKDLSAVCRRLATHPFVTVDTEFLRETTFWPRLCVVQIASEEEAVAVDAMAEGLDLAPFFELMADSRLTKVFHAARQDLEIIWNLARLIPAPLFDTQVAAMVCGFGDQISYGDLVKTVTKVALDKSSRFTDWSRRPLLPAQAEYAIADVTYLRDIYKFLRAKLDETGRIGWLDDEMALLTSPSIYEQHPENAWERFRNRVRKPRDLSVLMEVAAWRESEAQTRDVPRSRVLKDDIMIELAFAAPKTPETLGNLRAFPRGMERSRAGADILAAIERGLARDPKTLPKLDRERRNGSNGATVELLRVLLRHVSESHGVAAKMIASVEDLEAIAADDHAEVAALTGWRRDLFGAQALELKHGRLALTVEGGKVVPLEWRDEAPPENGAA
ncbi:MAG: Ribonuclease D [Beijerinckiaceae bacterium]|jgi:ribonuclease D|nr:MAG: Ribonuclease D [Beijerinckiaceae bacterium]